VREESINTILAVFFVVVGVLLLFVKVDREQLEKHVHTMPMYALLRFRWYRYGAAAAFFVLAALGYFNA
jgi:hypothetical protein